MNDLFFIVFIIFVVTGLIYFVYRVILGSDKNDEGDLQITSSELLEQVKIMHRNKKYHVVESLAKKYLEKKFNDVDIRTVLVKSLSEAGKIYEAIDQAKIIIKLKPENCSMKIFLAKCYYKVSKASKSIKVLQEVIEADPSNSIAIKELAEVYLKTNQKKSAVKLYEKLDEFIDNNQEKARNKALIAQIYEEFGLYDLSIEQYCAILELYPADIKVKRRLIELYNVTSQYGLLIDSCNEVLALHSVDEDGLWVLEIIVATYRKIHEYDKALEYVDLMMEHPLSDKFKVKKIIAGILLEKGLVDESIELLNSMVVKELQDVEIKKALAKSYEMKSDFGLAVDMYKEILKEVGAEDVEQIHFEMSNLYSNWAISLFMQDNNEECFNKFATALKYFSDNAEIYFNLGNVNKIIKNYNEALVQYKKALELDPSNADYHYAMAECYEDLQSIYEQKKSLLECLKYDPTNAKAHYKLGIYYASQNDNPSAMASLRCALEYDRNFVEAKRKLALMLEHIGNKEEAIALYEEILKLNPENEEILNNLKMLQ